MLKELYKQLEAQFSPLQNFKAYRDLLDKYSSQTTLSLSDFASLLSLLINRTKAAGKPGFPYLPLVLRDITYAHENPSWTANGLLNFQKLEILGKQIIGTYRLPTHRPITTTSSTTPTTTTNADTNATMCSNRC